MYGNLIAASDYGHLWSLSFLLADAVLAQGRVDEALELTEAVEADRARGRRRQTGWRRVRAKALARQGQIEEAVQLAREAVAIAEQTEYHELHVQSVAALGEVLLLARSDEADDVLQRALDLPDRRGTSLALRRRQLLGPPVTRSFGRYVSGVLRAEECDRDHRGM